MTKLVLLTLAAASRRTASASIGRNGWVEPSRFDTMPSQPNFWRN